MNKNAIWWIVGGLAVAAGAYFVIRAIRKPKADEVLDSTLVTTREDFPGPQDAGVGKTAGQTLAESFAVILKRSQPRPDKPAKTPKAPQPYKAPKSTAIVGA